MQVASIQSSMKDKRVQLVDETFFEPVGRSPEGLLILAVLERAVRDLDNPNVESDARRDAIKWFRQPWDPRACISDGITFYHAVLEMGFDRSQIEWIYSKVDAAIERTEKLCRERNVSRN